MSILLPIIAVAGFLIISNNKKSSVSAPVPKSKGFTISNCSLTITDSNKAFEYTYNLGACEAKKIKITDLDIANEKTIKSLFGNCINTKPEILFKDKNTALFIYEMFRYLYTGMASIHFEAIGWYLDKLKELKEYIAKFNNIDTSDFKIQLTLKS